MDWNEIYETSQKYPKLPIVVEQCEVEAFFNLGYLMPLLEATSNVYLETNRVHEYLALDAMVERVGGGRFIYGSNMPVDDPYPQLAVITLGLFSQEDKRRIAHENLENLFADVAELIVNYVNILEQRYSDTHTEFVEIELEITDPKYPLHTLAVETGSTVEFDTVADATEETVRVLVSVTEGDPEQVYRRAGDVASITTVEWFGDPAHGQLALTIQKPFLASKVGKHGGRLVASVSDGDVTCVRVEMPSTVAQRPLVQSLTTRYSGIDMIAHRQTTGSDGPAVADPGEFLTDRQYEILRAAYYGGYYETPREITGEELAESFDVSSPTVYTHLQSAHLRLLERLFEQR